MCAVLCLVAQSCPTPCSPTDCNLPGSSVHGDSPGKNTRVGCHAFLQWFFPTQGLNLLLLHCRQILNCWATREAQRPGGSHLYFSACNPEGCSERWLQGHRGCAKSLTGSALCERTEDIVVVPSWSIRAERSLRGYQREETLLPY